MRQPVEIDAQAECRSATYKSVFGRQHEVAESRQSPRGLEESIERHRFRRSRYIDTLRFGRDRVPCIGGSKGQKPVAPGHTNPIHGSGVADDLANRRRGDCARRRRMPRRLSAA
jgi:hypothetical protein